MTTAAPLTGDDLELIAERAVERAEPAAGAADLVGVVDNGMLADGNDAAAALGMAAELLLQADDLAGSLALAERSIAAHRAADSPGDFPRMFRAKLLFLLDRPDEAMAELTALRPLLSSDPDAAHEITEALLAGDRGEVAHEWLTLATREAQEAFARTETFDDGGADATAVLYALVTERHSLRHELGLPHDSLDEMAESIEEAVLDHQRDQLVAAVSAPILFFPRDEFDKLGELVPALAEVAGIDWDDHRADIERSLSARSTAGHGTTRLVAGSAGDLAALIQKRGVEDPLDDDVLDDYATALDKGGHGRAWPPARNEGCWCGSGTKYKKCCLPRSRG
jgi:hypothetical protein